MFSFHLLLLPCIVAALLLKVPFHPGRILVVVAAAALVVVVVVVVVVVSVGAIVVGCRSRRASGARAALGARRAFEPRSV